MPIMLDLSDDIPVQNMHTDTPTGPIVVVGSMQRMEEYQELLGVLRGKGGEVRGEMVDRVVQGGECERSENHVPERSEEYRLLRAQRVLSP
jgi:hypothetical protein